MIELICFYNGEESGKLEVFNIKGDQENDDIVFRYFKISDPRHISLYSLKLNNLEEITIDTLIEHYEISDNGFFIKQRN